MSALIDVTPEEKIVARWQPTASITVITSSAQHDGVMVSADPIRDDMPMPR